MCVCVCVCVSVCLSLSVCEYMCVRLYVLVQFCQHFHVKFRYFFLPSFPEFLVQLFKLNKKSGKIQTAFVGLCNKN